MYMIYSRSYSFLFTLIIAFTVIFDNKFNIQILDSYLFSNNQCAYKTMKNRFSNTASSFITKKAFKNHEQYKQPLTHQP